MATLTKALLLLLLALPLLAGCGRKGPLRPKLKPLPASVQELTLAQRGAAFELRWEAPTANQDGSPLEDLGAFRIYRADFAPDDDCPPCREPRELWREVSARSGAGDAPGAAYGLSDGRLAPGRTYRYRVAAVTRGGFEGAPAQAERTYVEPPPAPAGLSAASHDRLLRLAWQAPELPEGAELLGYRLYRTGGEAPFPAAPLHRGELREAAYEDFGVQNGRPYRYAVSAVVRVGEHRVESALSAEVVATPREGR